MEGDGARNRTPSMAGEHRKQRLLLYSAKQRLALGAAAATLGAATLGSRTATLRAAALGSRAAATLGAPTLGSRTATLRAAAFGTLVFLLIGHDTTPHLAEYPL
jgi:hypothetical protein